MNRKYYITDISEDGFLHSRIYDYKMDIELKMLIINYGFADLKSGGALVNCTITISGWTNLEVLKYQSNKIIHTYTESDIPELKSIVNYEYYNNILILEDLCGLDRMYQFRFDRPIIQVTGDYDPD